MAETQIKKLGTNYSLSNGKYHILASIAHDTNKITIFPGRGTATINEFKFLDSTPEMCYAIGTLIRDAADLVKDELKI